MFQTAMLPFPYSLSCQSFVDVSDGLSVNSTSPSGTPSPPAYVTRCYENLTPKHMAPAFSFAHQQHFKSLRQEQVLSSSKHSSYGLHKKSFTIEAILGLNPCKDYDDELSSKKMELQELSLPLRVSDARRHERLMASSPYVVPSATPRSALTAVSSFFSAQAAIKETKSKSLLARDSLSPLDGKDHKSPTSSNSSNSNTGSIRSSSQKTLSGGKSKRIRTIFTPEQLERLENEFERQQYMVGPERLYLASALNLTEAQVKVWFQNRRIKWRKQHLEMQQARLAQLREAETSESPNGSELQSLAEEVSPNNYEDLLDDIQLTG